MDFEDTHCLQNIFLCYFPLFLAGGLHYGVETTSKNTWKVSPRIQILALPGSSDHGLSGKADIRMMQISN
jgi:hypothetical protein